MPELTECKTDSDGNILYEKYSDGTERWFDANGNVLRGTVSTWQVLTLQSFV
jgi:hypothetical protein